MHHCKGDSDIMIVVGTLCNWMMMMTMVVGKTIDCDGLTYTRDIVTQSLMVYSVWGLYPCRRFGTTFYVLVWEFSDTF